LTLTTTPCRLPLNAQEEFTLAQAEDVELHSMTDATAEPLIAQSRDHLHDARYSDDDAEDVEVDESALMAPGLFIWGLTICAGVSGLLFGYEYVTQGVVPVPQSAVRSHAVHVLIIM
jgi:hypothetical protein